MKAMKEQQSQEWTPEMIDAKCDECDQLRAALAAEQQAASNAFTKGYDQGHADAIAAERAKREAVMCPLCGHGHLGYIDDEPCVSCGCEGKFVGDVVEQLIAERKRADSRTLELEAMAGRYNRDMIAEREKREVLLEALSRIAMLEANDPEELAAGLKQTQSYKIATAALAKVNVGK